MKSTILLATTLCLLGAASLQAADPAPASVAEPPSPAPTPMPQAELRTRLAQKDTDLVVLDVRTPEEFAAGHVPGALNLPHDQLPARLAELSSIKDKAVVLYCRTGRRTAIAAQALRAAGFARLLHLQGDYQAWHAAGHPTEK